MIKIPLIKSSKILESNFYSGRIGVKDLIDNSEFPRYEPGSKSIENGYQRAPKDNRVSAIKDRVRNDPESMDSFITNITVNVRSEEAEKSNIIKVLHDGEDLDLGNRAGQAVELFDQGRDERHARRRARYEKRIGPGIGRDTHVRENSRFE